VAISILVAYRCDATNPTRVFGARLAYVQWVRLMQLGTLEAKEMANPKPVKKGKLTSTKLEKKAPLIVMVK
jgi:hypothetical protein